MLHLGKLLYLKLNLNYDTATNENKLITDVTAARLFSQLIENPLSLKSIKFI